MSKKKEVKPREPYTIATIAPLARVLYPLVKDLTLKEVSMLAFRIHILSTKEAVGL
ncbi:MAG: hypothetical protein WDA22_15715 [Bacteroidota bacterium]